MNLFDRYLSLWVALCIVAGVALGHLLPGLFASVACAEIARVNLPVAGLVWLMIIPMLLKIDFGALGQVREHWRGVGVTLFINWAVKPFSMASAGLALHWPFVSRHGCHRRASFVLHGRADSPCRCTLHCHGVRMVSACAKVEPHYTLSQVALNDVIMVIAFAPLVGLLARRRLDHRALGDPAAFSAVVHRGARHCCAAMAARADLVSGPAALRADCSHVLQPVSLVALLTTLVMLFGFQGEQIIAQPLVIALLSSANPDPGLLQRVACLLR